MRFVFRFPRVLMWVLAAFFNFLQKLSSLILRSYCRAGLNSMQAMEVSSNQGAGDLGQGSLPEPEIIGFGGLTNPPQKVGGFPLTISIGLEADPAHLL